MPEMRLPEKTGIMIWLVPECNALLILFTLLLLLFTIIDAHYFTPAVLYRESYSININCWCIVMFEESVRFCERQFWRFRVFEGLVFVEYTMA